MFRKRRYKKKTIGKLEVFFKKKAYTGLKKNLVYFKSNFTTSTLQSSGVIIKLRHYKIVTKKKV